MKKTHKLPFMAENDYKKPYLKDIGSAKDIIKGGTFNKESGGADGLFDSDNNPVSVPD